MLLGLPLLILWSLVFSPAVVVAQDDSEVPAGTTSSWLYGRHQLAEGNIEEALRNLHYAYRVHPDVPIVAWDFQEALIAGNYFKDALQVLDKLVDDWPDEASYRMQRSQVNLQLGNNKDALADLRELRKRGLQDLDVVVGEATILAGMGKPNKALDTLNDGLEEFPEDGPRLYLTMSVIYDQEGRYEELQELLDKAVSEYPDSPQLHDIRMRSLLNLGREDEALAAAREADERFSELWNRPGVQSDEDQLAPDESTFSEAPAPPSFVVELADIHAQNASPEKAINILQPLFDEGALDRSASLWLARLYMGTGNIELGMTLVDEILERWPNTGQAWFLRGRKLEGEGKIEEALLLYEKAVGFAPDDAQVRMGYVRGMLLAWERDLTVPVKTAEQEEKVEILRQQCEEAAKLVSPADYENQLVLGYAFRSNGQLDRAVVAFRQAANLPDLHLPASLQLSVCFDEMADVASAQGVLEELRKQYPENPEVANSLGYFLAEKAKDLERAQDLISEALAAEPGVGAYLDSMGWVLYQQGEFEDAFDYMIQAVNALPDDPVILEHLALVLVAMDQRGEAEEMLLRAMVLGGDPVRLKQHLDDLNSPGDQ